MNIFIFQRKKPVAQTEKEKERTELSIKNIQTRKCMAKPSV